MKTSIGAIVQGGTSIQYKTGDWRESRPIFVSRIAPCREACPAGNDIQGFIWEARHDRFDQAYQILLSENPFPSICGRVCDHVCEANCNRKEFDESIAIHGIERFIGDYGLGRGIPFPASRPRLQKRVAVVGSGPAGLSCAYHLTRLGYDVTVFDRSSEAGGMLRWGIPEYRLPTAIVDAEIDKLRRMGIRLETNVSLGGDFLKQGLKEYCAIFLALGAQKNRSMGIPGEPLSGVQSGLHFLNQIRKGEVPHPAERVAVIGGGNTAIDVARTALRLGSAPVLLYRRTREEMPAVSGEIEEALREGVRMEFLTIPVDVTKGTDQRLRLDCVRSRLTEPGPDGRKIPIPIEGSGFFIEVDRIYAAIGETIDSSALLQALRCEEGGIVTDDWGRTTLPGVFAGGDATSGPRTVAHAIGSGKKAALAMDCFIQGWHLDKARSLFLGKAGSLSMAQWLDPLPPSHRNDQVVRFEDLNQYYFEHQFRERMDQLPVEGKKRRSFDEVNLGFSKEAVVREAARCFRCGTCNFCENCYSLCPDSAIWTKGEWKTFEINYEFCKGCGICAHECTSHAIEIIPEEK